MSKRFKNRSLVSVIMNCYNGEAYLDESIKSVLSQTYENWELIFWDNKSQDKSAEIFKSYKDKRFKYFFANEHTSLYKARNLAIEKSKGDFIAFLDSDDLWDKNKLELQIHYFSIPEVGVVFSNFCVIKKTMEKKKLYTNKKLSRGMIYNDLINNYNIGTLTTVIRKNFYLKLKEKFDERFSIIGDFDLFLRLSKLCVFESIQAPLAYYRLHGKNLSILRKEQEIDELETWMRENKDNLSNLNIKNFKKNIIRIRFINSKIEGNYKKCFNILLNSGLHLFDIKTLIKFLIPTVLLKKLFWYYQE